MGMDGRRLATHESVFDPRGPGDREQNKTTLSEERTPVGSREKSTRDREHEVERYREAAALALDHLQWCITYLYGIRKGSIARALEKNRATIIERSGIHR
jgi:hypothetical protein